MRTDLHIAVTCVFAGFFFVGLARPESRATPTSQTQSSEGAHGVYHGFTEAVARHLALHRELGTDAVGPRGNCTALEVMNPSDRLAAAIRAARPRAHQGEFFDGPATFAIQRRIRDELHSTATSAALSTIDADHPAFRHPRIYVRFPASTEPATMPQSLLRLLPPLPDILEYRIVGEYLVLRDVKAALVLDYIPGAVPRGGR